MQPSPFVSVALTALLALGGAMPPAAAAPVSRAAPTAGSVVSVRTGEEIEFIDVAGWRGVEVLQDVKAGDILRTNASGQLAILFSDRTQIRVARNSTLVVKELGEGRDTTLSLTRGTIFARAARGGTGVTVETPAAAAAIRGTDWSMTVTGERTSLTVLEGEVELYNPHGSVLVRAGEAAAATLGQAPTKLVLVDSDEREQMLVNLSLRSAFGALPTLDAPESRLRGERARLAAVPPAARSTADRVLAAEIALEYEGRAAAYAAVAAARERRLDAAQEARLRYVEAALAGIAGRYGEAARGFAAATPHLPPGRRELARYQAYFARSLADPQSTEPPPRSDGTTAAGVVGDAVIAAFLESPAAALALLKRHEARHGGDASYQSAIADVAMLVGDRETAGAALARAFALDPDSTDALASRAMYRANFVYDIEGAHADISRAVQASPGTSGYWNTLGLIEEARDGAREAEAAYLRAIEMEPEDPVAYGNYAILLLDQGRVAEARANIDRALALDPSFEVVLFALGRYELQSGRNAAGIEALLRATTANPGYANGLLMLAAAYYADSRQELAEQAIENADRLDPNDPVTAQYRAVVAIDEYRADDGIRFARQSVERTRARGGDYASVGATLESGTTVGDAFRFVGLDAWARYYGDIVFDPFAAAGHFDQALTGSADSFAIGREMLGAGLEPTFNDQVLSSLMQGLLLDPTAVAASKLRPNIIRAPFLEAELGGGFAHLDDWGWSATGEVQGLSYAPFPVAAYVQGSWSEIDPSFATQDDRTGSATAMLGAAPTPFDRVAVFATVSHAEGGLAFPGDPLAAANTRDGTNLVGTAGWSHTFARRNVLDVAIFGTSSRSEADVARLDPYFGLFDVRLGYDAEETSLVASARHAVGVGDVTLRYGGDVGRLETEGLSAFFPGTGAAAGTLRLDPTGAFRWGELDSAYDVARAYADLLATPGNDLRLEAGLVGSYADGAETIGVRDALLGPSALVERTDLSRLDGRAGAAWAPAEGHWLRGAFLSGTPLGYASSLAPVGVVGLQPNQAPVEFGGRAETAIARWDAEWTRHFFTAAEYQHQEFEQLSIAIPGRLATIDLDEGRIDRLSATVNIWLGGGVGLFGTAVRSWSEVRGPVEIAGLDIPYVPETAGRLGVAWVHPSRLRVTAAANYVGERHGSLEGDRLDGIWSLDATASWETPDRRIRAELEVANLLDEAFDAAPPVFSPDRTQLVLPAVPGRGRSVRGALKVRF